MNCPNCGVPLMGGMVICPKCKYDTRTKDGGDSFVQHKLDLERKKEEEAKKLQEDAVQRQKQREREREAEALRLGPAKESVKRFSGEFLGMTDIVYRIDGARGRSIDIYPYKCVITTGVTIGSVLTNNATDGEKTIYFQDCIGLQIKYPGLTLGYVQFETAAPTQNNTSSNFFNENTFTFEGTQITADEMTIVINYIKGQMDKIKEAQRNSWMK